MISFKQRGDFSKLTKFFERAKEVIKMGELDKYGQEGVKALSAATPVRTGKTAASWEYEIVHTNGCAKIIWKNTNIQNGVPIAIVLQYGHAARNGRWVQGRDYIKPAIRPVFDKIANEAWKEVTKL